MTRSRNSLPENLNPVGVRCIPVYVPDDPDWIVDFTRAIRVLTYYRHWESVSDVDADVNTVRGVWDEVTYNPLIDTILAGVTCDAGFPNETDNCIEYPLYAPFMSYIPYNPFDPTSAIPAGYATEPFYIHDGGGSLPPAYLSGDLIVPFSAINLVDYTVFGTPISIKIQVTGSGQVEIDLLALPQGGIAVLKVGDNPPNVIDIINGIFDPSSETLIELELDNTSIPPEDDVVSAQEINIDVDPGVVSTIWITFIPQLDDSFIPLKFGGGIRSVQLCGFEEMAGDMGVTDIRITNGVLEKFQDGAWTAIGTVLEDCTDVEDCLATSATIGALQATDSQLQSDIANLQATDTNLQNQITANDNDITTLQNQMSQAQADILENTIDILQNTSDIASNLSSITQLQSVVTALKNDGLNVLEDIPDTATEPNQACGSAWRVAEQLEQFIIDTVNDASTITITEWLTGLFGLGGFDDSLSVQLWQFIVANSNPNLLTEVNNTVANVAEHFYCNNFDLTGTKADIVADSSITADAESAWIGAIDSWSFLRLKTEIAIGSNDTTRDCSSFCPSAGSCAFYDFSVASYFVSGGYPPGSASYNTNRWEKGFGVSGNEFSISIPVPVGVRITEIEIDHELSDGSPNNGWVWVDGILNQSNPAVEIYRDNSIGANAYARRIDTMTMDYTMQHGNFALLTYGATSGNTNRTYKVYSIKITYSDGTISSGVAC